MGGWAYPANLGSDIGKPWEQSMKFSRVRVQTYRSIVDSGIVEIEDGVTVVIGKNEQGKTNFLRGIRAFNPEEQFTPSDLPNHLRPSLEEKKPEEISIVTVW